MTAVGAAVLAAVVVLLWRAPHRVGPVRPRMRAPRRWLSSRLTRPASDSAPAGLPEALELLAAALASGVPLVRALEILSDVSDQEVSMALDLVRRSLQLGSGEPEAWLLVREVPGWEAVAPDLAMAAESGASVLELLSVHAAELRRDVASAAHRRARAVGVRAVLPLIVCFLPAFVLVGVVPIIVGLVSGFLGG